MYCQLSRMKEANSIFDMELKKNALAYPIQRTSNRANFQIQVLLIHYLDSFLFQAVTQTNVYFKDTYSAYKHTSH